MIRILIADDHPVVRRGIAQILDDEPDLEVAGAAESGDEVLAQLSADGWSVLVLDLSMPDHQGLDLLKEIRRRWPDLPILVLSIHPEEQYAVRCLGAGARGYLDKKSAPEELVRAVRMVASGTRYFSSTLAERLVRQAEAEQAPRHEALSDREFQVLRLIASGRTTGEIAEQLGLSVKTVSTYRARLLEKMEPVDQRRARAVRLRAGSGGVGTFQAVCRRNADRRRRSPAAIQFLDDRVVSNAVQVFGVNA